MPCIYVLVDETSREELRRRGPGLPAVARTDAVGVEIFEQTHVGKNGHAVTMLWAEVPDGGDADAGEPTTRLRNVLRGPPIHFCARLLGMQP